MKARRCCSCRAGRHHRLQNWTESRLGRKRSRLQLAACHKQSLATTTRSDDIRAKPRDTLAALTYPYRPDAAPSETSGCSLTYRRCTPTPRHAHRAYWADANGKRTPGGARPAFPPPPSAPPPHPQEHQDAISPPQCPPPRSHLPFIGRAAAQVKRTPLHTRRHVLCQYIHRDASIPLPVARSSPARSPPHVYGSCSNLPPWRTYVPYRGDTKVKIRTSQLKTPRRDAPRLLMRRRWRTAPRPAYADEEWPTRRWDRRNTQFEHHNVPVDHLSRLCTSDHHDFRVLRRTWCRVRRRRS
jgi:hypothetical protein